MTARLGVDAPRAVASLIAAGYTPARIAHDLAVTVRTVRRWHAGIHQPSRSNRSALLEWLDVEHARLIHRRRLDSRVPAVLDAAEALKTDAERQQEQAEREEFRARYWHGRGGNTAATPAPSITAEVDPFALIPTDTDMTLAEAF